MSLSQRANHQRWRYQNRKKMFTEWKTQNGRLIPVHRMDSLHIHNVIRYFKPSRIWSGKDYPKGCWNPEIQAVMKAELKRRGE